MSNPNISMPNPNPLDALTPDVLERLAALCDLARAMKPPLTEADYDALSSLCRAVKKAEQVMRAGPLVFWALAAIGDNSIWIARYGLHIEESDARPTLASALSTIWPLPEGEE